MKQNKSQFDPNDYLNQREQELSQKHHRRLQKITQEALQNHQSHQKKWHTEWLKPTLASAFGVLLVASIVLFYKNDKQDYPKTLNAELPAWVIDTDVPLTLIENLDFYDWLAAQTDDQQAKKKTSIIVAFNELRQYYSGKRFTASNTTQRFFGAATDLGEIQR